jgi:hypothetical protein
MADINNKKRKDRDPQVIKVNIHPIDGEVLQQISTTFNVIVNKIKEKHL